MKSRIALVSLLAVGLLGSLSFGAPVGKYVIENGRAEPDKYYDEKPALLEQSKAQLSEGEAALHFRSTDEKAGRVFLTKFNWPDAADFTSIAANGTIRFDLWVDDASKVGSAPDAMGDRFEFTVGSRSNDKFTSWYIPSTLLQNKKWNKVRLALRDGLPQIEGSTVNDTPLSKGKEPQVVGSKETVWSQVNYHRWCIPTYGATDFYLDNCVAEAVTAK